MLRVFTFDMNKMSPAEAEIWVQHLQERFCGDEIVAFPKQLGHIGYDYHDYLKLKNWVKIAERKLKEMEVWYANKSKSEEISANGQ